MDLEIPKSDAIVDCPLLSLLPSTLRTARHRDDPIQRSPKSTGLKGRRGDASKELESSARGQAMELYCKEAKFSPKVILRKIASYKDHFSFGTYKAEASKEITSDGLPYSPLQTLTNDKSGDTFHCQERYAESFECPNKLDVEHNTEIEAGLVEDKERKISSLVDTLLSSCRDLDEDQGVAVLQQSLQIKPVKLGRFHLTDAHMLQGNDFRVFNNSATHKRSGRNQLLQTSPIPPKSPLSAISALRRIASLKDKHDDPFKLPSDDDADGCPRGSNPGRRKQKHSVLPDFHIGGLEKTNLLSGDASRSMVMTSESLSLVDKLHLPVLEAEECPVNSALFPNKAKRQQTQIGDQRKCSSKQCLADAGMRWSSGVRRSTRIRSRPLEYWRGERFLYGRIHDSLSTVIGVKKVSPGKDGTLVNLKVESFVPDEYTDLVSQAALY